LLTHLPIFNDEAIYLDWGWKETHIPGALFYSLIDGKQPLLMWIFGISQSIFADQLFAGRIIAVGAGSLTMLGLFKIGERFFSKRIGFLASIFYILVPLFSSFDRLALMESSISAAGIWSLFYLLLLLKEQKMKYAIYVGFLLGLGYFIKSSMLIFVFTAYCLLFFAGMIKVFSTKKVALYTLITGGSFIITAFLLLIQPLFWQSLSMNDRYSLTISEIVSLPLAHFLKNAKENGEIMLVFITPFIVFLGFIQAFRLVRKVTINKNIAFWFFISLFLQTLMVRDTTQRYVVSFLPLLCLFAAEELTQWRNKLGKAYSLLVSTVILLPIFLTVIQMTNPVKYVKLTLPFTRETESGLVYGQISGYGIEEIIQKIKTYQNKRPLVVATAINIGNPESTMHVYFHKSEDVQVGFIDRRMFGETLTNYNCIRTQTPFLYISRDFQQSEMNDYFLEVGRVKHPYSDYSLGMYTFKPCKEKFIDFDPYLLTK